MTNQNNQLPVPWHMERAGYVLAMAVLQSPLYATGDDELRNAVALFVPPSPESVVASSEGAPK